MQRDISTVRWAFEYFRDVQHFSIFSSEMNKFLFFFFQIYFQTNKKSFDFKESSKILSSAAVRFFSSSPREPSVFCGRTGRVCYRRYVCSFYFIFFFRGNEGGVGRHKKFYPPPFSSSFPRKKKKKDAARLLGCSEWPWAIFVYTHFFCGGGGGGSCVSVSALRFFFFGLPVSPTHLPTSCVCV